jgi:ribosomal-protein-serine acetyltransferase
VVRKGMERQDLEAQGRVMFSALRFGEVTLQLINQENLGAVKKLFLDQSVSIELVRDIETSYAPSFDDQRRRCKFGFYTLINGKLAGLSLLGINNWDHLRGYTGADTLPHMRGRGVAPASKPHLFYLGFHLLGLNRIETGCFASNISSRRSIEKTPGFQFEGCMREYGFYEGKLDDELRYAILKKDWEKLYDLKAVEVIC